MDMAALKRYKDDAVIGSPLDDDGPSSVDSPQAMPNVTIWKRCDAAGFKLRVDSAPIEAAAN